MNKYLLCFIVLLWFSPLQAQESKYEKLFEEYTAQRRYILDQQQIVVCKVVDSLQYDKTRIYTIIKTFLVRTYSNYKAVIQTDGLREGLIVCKGLFPGLAGFALERGEIKAYYLLRIDFTDGKARIICSASSMIVSAVNLYGEKRQKEYSISQYYPLGAHIVGKMGLTEQTQLRAFIALVDAMNELVESTAKTIKEGGTLQVEKQPW